MIQAHVNFAELEQPVVYTNVWKYLVSGFKRSITQSLTTTFIDSYQWMPIRYNIQKFTEDGATTFILPDSI